MAPGGRRRYLPGMFTLTFHARNSSLPRIECRTTLVKTAEAAQDEAVSMAADIAPDCELIEIEGSGVREFWVRCDGEWQRDDRANAGTTRA
jgi:hypothetical protein